MIYVARLRLAQERKRARGRGGGKPGGWDDDPGSQGMIPRHFKRKKIFVTDERTKRGQTDVTVEIVM